MNDPFRKTRTAAGYLILHSDGDAARYLKIRGLFSALQAGDRALATGDPKPGDAIADVLMATAELVGRTWLRANTGDPDVRRLDAALQEGRLDQRDAYRDFADAAQATVSLAERDIGELDDLLSRVLWARYGPP